MAKHCKKIVELPHFDEAAAYNANRKINGLIRTQLVHLHTAENLALKPQHRTGVNINTLLSEGDASRYIAKATALLHAHGSDVDRSSGRKPPKKKAKSARRARPGAKASSAKRSSPKPKAKSARAKARRKK